MQDVIDWTAAPTFNLSWTVHSLAAAFPALADGQHTARELTSSCYAHLAYMFDSLLRFKPSLLHEEPQLLRVRGIHNTCNYDPLSITTAPTSLSSRTCVMCRRCCATHTTQI